MRIKYSVHEQIGVNESVVEQVHHLDPGSKVKLLFLLRVAMVLLVVDHAVE